MHIRFGKYSVVPKRLVLQGDTGSSTVLWPGAGILDACSLLFSAMSARKETLGCKFSLALARLPTFGNTLTFRLLAITYCSVLVVCFHEPCLPQHCVFVSRSSHSQASCTWTPAADIIRQTTFCDLYPRIASDSPAIVLRKYTCHQQIATHTRYIEVSQTSVV